MSTALPRSSFSSLIKQLARPIALALLIAWHGPCNIKAKEMLSHTAATIWLTDFFKMTAPRLRHFRGHSFHGFASLEHRVHSKTDKVTITHWCVNTRKPGDCCHLQCLVRFDTRGFYIWMCRSYQQ